MDRTPTSLPPLPQSPCHTWQKVDYILELGEWLYTHQFPPQDALDQLHWATGMLISLPSAHQGLYSYVIVHESNRLFMYCLEAVGTEHVP